jgi:hypothetical protein
LTVNAEEEPGKLYERAGEQWREEVGCGLAGSSWEEHRVTSADENPEGRAAARARLLTDRLVTRSP